MRIAGNVDSSVQENREGRRGTEEGNSNTNCIGLLLVLTGCPPNPTNNHQ